MSGFREQLFNDSVPILGAWLNRGALVSIQEAEILRRAWCSSKRGNILCDAIWEIGEPPLPEFIERICLIPGFLNSHEIWHTRRVRNKLIKIYRGCPQAEIDKGKLGYSWSLSHEVASFFAGRGECGGVVVEAVIPCRQQLFAWLDTSEMEVIAAVYIDDVCSVSMHKLNSRPKWFDDEGLQPRLRPTGSTQPSQ